jgi:GT2 family glycosyltransferase
MDKIAAILTCFNRKQKTLTCLERLSRQEGLGTSLDLDVYLVDDGSTDGTGDAVRAAYPRTHVIQGNGQLFWNRGMHLAWKEAAAAGDYDYYLWVNDDTHIEDFCVRELVSCAQATGNGAIICASIRSAVSGEWTYGGYIVAGGKNVPVTPTGKMEPVTVINGNCVLVPRQVFQRVGNIDPVFIHAIGDLDYGLRAARKNVAIFIAPHFLGYCEKNPSMPKWCLPQVPLRDRIKNLYSPLGNSHPYYFFIYEYRHFGIFTALKHYFTIHLRLCIPRLWKL